jgi:anti-sigma regulatory factor (Ser/Thr protein kinase)
MHEALSAADRTPCTPLSPTDTARTLGEAGLPSLTIWIAPSHRNAAFARDRLEVFCRANGVPEDDLYTFVIAAGEALANALEHGHAGEMVEVLAVTTAIGIYVAVVDEGRGMSPPRGSAELPSPDSERGRGFPMMRRCTDLFAVRARPGAGTTIVLGRHFRAVPGASRPRPLLAPGEVAAATTLHGADLARMPFGVLVVDRAGTIVAYDPREEHHEARRAPEMIGKNLFLDVAPWATVHALASRFGAWVDGAHTQLVPLEFTFALGASVQHVTILLGRLALERAHATICIARSDALHHAAYAEP